MTRPTICLSMIVKNEAHVIERCLASVAPHIDEYLIVDTGSTDGTIKTIEAFMAQQNKPGKVVCRPWVDFAHNRNEALELARKRADYCFFIDADETFEVDEGVALPALHMDAYEVAIRLKGSEMTFYRLQLVSNALPFRYVGVLHEVITCPEQVRRGRLSGAVIRSHADSARNSGDIREKYARDAAVFEKALLTEPDNARYVFYLGQSYKDAGKLEEALVAYTKRTTMGGFAEEVWYAELMRARLLSRLGRNAEAQAAYLTAYELRPTRAESLCELAKLHRLAKQYNLAYLFASRAVKIKLPKDVLFVETSVYNWRALDELALAAYYLGEYEESKRISDGLLARSDLPTDQRARIEKNVGFARTKLAV